MIDNVEFELKHPIKVNVKGELEEHTLLILNPPSFHDRKFALPMRDRVGHALVAGSRIFDQDRKDKGDAPQEPAPEVDAEDNAEQEHEFILIVMSLGGFDWLKAMDGLLKIMGIKGCHLVQLPDGTFVPGGVFERLGGEHFEEVVRFVEAYVVNFMARQHASR